MCLDMLLQITENSEHVYKEGVHWKRGAVLGTGAFSTCYQARDVRTGSLMAVKQVSVSSTSIEKTLRDYKPVLRLTMFTAGSGYSDFPFSVKLFCHACAGHTYSIMTVKARSM